MNDIRWQHVINAGKVMLAFVNAFAGALAAYPAPDLSPLVRLLAVAVVAGCGAALLVMNPPGGAALSPEHVQQISDELEARMRTSPRG